MKIRALIENRSNPERYYWRVESPFSILKLYGIDAETISTGEDIPEDTDILIIPKMLTLPEDRDETSELFEWCRSKNIILVYDADDDVFSPAYVQYMTRMTLENLSSSNLHPYHIATIIQQLEQQRENYLWTMSQCDAVIVANKEFAKYVRTITTLPVYHVENAINVAAFEACLQPKHTEEYTTIGWAGGSRPQSELAVMLEAWNQIAFKHEQVQFVISGWQPDLQKYEHLSSERVISVPWKSMDEYPTSMQVDIGCVCVGDTAFGAYKTPIKAWEFALAGAMIVGSKNLYTGQPIVVCETVNDWVHVLSWYIVGSESRVRLAEVYKRYVKGQYDLQYNWLYWADAYEKIMKVRK